MIEAGPVGAAPDVPATSARAAGRRWLGVSAAVLAVAAFFALLAWGMLARRDGRAAGLSVNATGRAIELRVRPAPAVELALYEGGTFRLADQAGRVVVLNFWASWCPPCREEAPALEASWRAYRERGVVLVGVNLWDREPEARAFLREFAITYPNGPDAGGRTAIELAVRGIPETFVVDRGGQLVRKWIGPLTEAQFAAMVGDLLG